MTIARVLIATLIAMLSPAAYAGNVVTLNAVKGATIWFAEDHTVPMVAIEVSLPAGSVYDPANKAGLASFAGAMLDEGAGGLDSKAFHDDLADRAIEFSASTGRDWLEITLRCESAKLADTLHLIGLALQHPRFDADAVTRVRAQMIASLQDEDEEPGSVAEKAFYAGYFAGHAYAHPPEGTTAGMAAISQADLRAFVRAHWVRGGLKIAIAGDANPAQLPALLSAAFGPLSGVTPPAPAPFRPQKHGTIFQSMDVSQPSAVFGLPAPPRSDPQYMAVYVVNTILGGKFSSRLTAEIRVKLGLTYDISTDAELDRRASLIVGSVATRREEMRRTLTAIRNVLKRLSTDGPTDQELADAKSYLTGSFPLAFASNAGTAGELAQFQQEGLPVTYVAQRNAAVAAVTLDDARRAAKLFDPARLLIAVAGTLPAQQASSKH